MSLLQFMSAQLRQPSGLFGRVLVGPLLNKSSAAMNRRTLELLELAPDDQVLEVGFGGGGLIQLMLPLVTRGRIVGVDFSADMVRLCARRFGAPIRAGRVELRCASAERLPCGDAEFSQLGTVNTLYFWSDPRATLVEFRRVLRPGGKLVVSFNPPATARKVPYTRYGFKLYEGPEVRGLLEGAGFRDVQLVSGWHKIGEFLCATASR